MSAQIYYDYKKLTPNCEQIERMRNVIIVIKKFDYRDFLPRGTGIVTRRPLILQLINGPED